MTKLSPTAVCCTALLSTPSYHASMHVSLYRSLFSNVARPSKFISVTSAWPRVLLGWIFWPLFTVRKFSEHEPSFNTLLHTPPVIEIHTREHRNTHADLLTDTQQLRWTSGGLRCLAKRHFDGSSRGQSFTFSRQISFGAGMRIKILNSQRCSRDLSVLTCLKFPHLDASHPLFSLELFAVLQPVDSRHWVSGSGTAEFDSVGGWNGQELLVHPVRPGPKWSLCWWNTKHRSVSVTDKQSLCFIRIEHLTDSFIQSWRVPSLKSFQ